MRVATIDIGTNTVLLLVAEVAPDGSLVPVAEHAEITRLGQGVDRTRRLAPDAVARTRECLERFGSIVQAHGAERVAVVGTSAMRDASGAEPLRATVRALFGVDARVVSGEEEARLTFRGALSGLPPENEPESENSDLGVFDIGGGSTEIVLGRMQGGSPRLSFARSFDVGSVRLTERYLVHDPPTPEEVGALREALRTTFAGVPKLAGRAVPVGVAGTVTTLCAVSLRLVPYSPERVHGAVLESLELERVLAQLTPMDVKARRLVEGMAPKRADVIVAGGMIALALLQHWEAQAMRVSDRGVRWGLALELGAAPAPDAPG